MKLLYGQFKNTGLWLSIAINLFLLVEYLLDHNNARNIVLIFWIQSITLGVQNVLMMLFSKTGQSLIMNGVPVKSGIFYNIFTAGFFTIHYGIFILAFGGIAVIEKKIPGNLGGQAWVYPAIMIILIGAVLELPSKIMTVRHYDVPLMKLMFVPYVRLLPLGAIFLGASYLESMWLFPLFLVLKLIVDMVYIRFLEVRPMEI